MTTEYLITEHGLEGNILVMDLYNMVSERTKYSHHDMYEIYYFPDENITLSVEGSLIDLEPGNLLLLSPHMMHRLIIERAHLLRRGHIGFSSKIFSLPWNGAQMLQNMLSEQRILKIDTPTAVREGMHQMFTDIQNNILQHTPYHDFCALASLYKLLISFEENINRADSKIPSVRNKQVREILLYIDEHISEDLNYSRISEHFFVSEKNLYQIFKKETGLSPTCYINERRILKARLLLEHGTPATEAAEQTGYQDYSSFYRNFKKGTGLSPADYIRKLPEPSEK